MTAYRTLLAKGYFPKELPPAFFTDEFAWYASTKAGRTALAKYKPQNNFTECTRYELALPGIDRRPVRIPHPFAFANLALMIAGNLRRLLKLAARSHFSRSRPIYTSHERRALRPGTNPPNLGREKALSRAGSAFLVKVDVSQFYPSLYTHAVGWAIDPALRDKANWKNPRLLGKKIDQALMDLQGKVSQGMPIGTDISFLLSEIVLARVDRSLSVDRQRAYRWFDDYEIACDTRDEAERLLAGLKKALDLFRLRVNPHKTRIVELPQATEDDWRDALLEKSKGSLLYGRDVVQFFDTAFRLRERFPSEPVLLYALGLLFKIRLPSRAVANVAQSCITQSIMSEPGSSQKAFSLLSFWAINGLSLDRDTLSAAIGRIVERHEHSGTSSDVAWALAFACAQNLPLGKSAGRALSVFHDDVTALQALDLHNRGLLPHGYSRTPIGKKVATFDLDGEHWLLAYEANRLGLLSSNSTAIGKHSLFSDMIQKNVAFYRKKTPDYSMVVHLGGAPSWVVHAWAKTLAKPTQAKIEQAKIEQAKIEPEIVKRMRKLVGQRPGPGGTDDELILGLQNAFEHRRIFELDSPDPYWG